jgi:hypothetical protein
MNVMNVPLTWPYKKFLNYFIVGSTKILFIPGAALTRVRLVILRVCLFSRWTEARCSDIFRPLGQVSLGINIKRWERNTMPSEVRHPDR